ncbi:MAG: (deoxy)nucleoside triphosphate pyrophosphohydrolase [Spirochaetaceae bacterium]|nr:(deoxy)nucleoside triphosphate pyrophosphohydrolase [Spirochaetaceae bacterium]
MKTISVVAAVIFRTTPEGVRSVFATQRGYGEYKGWWEFPGGKIEPGESPQTALQREIREELATEIHVGEHIGTIEYDYPAFHLSMQCFECRIISGNLELLEHENAAWLTGGTLHSVKWLPADITILDKVQDLLAKNKQNG